MPKKLGDLVKLQVSTDGVSWTPVEFQQGGTTTRGSSPADTSNKDSNRWSESTPGFRNWELSATGIHDESGTGQEIVRTAWEDNVIMYVQFVETSDPATNSGQAIVTDFSNDHPHDAASTFSATFQGTGELTKT
jgi:TP901-1 family phage major tail protein